jgi:hypothetical protein
MTMSFKVYNGPMPLPKCKRFYTFDGHTKNMVCTGNIDPELSDRLCLMHAKEYVALYDTDPNFKSALAHLFE